MKLAGKVALVTGASRGLGQSFAKAFLENGAKVCLSDVNAELGAKTLEELQSELGIENAAFITCDVRSDDDFKKAWDYCTETLGPIDVLVNNAGIDDEQDWKLTYDINVGGTTRGTLLAYERMGEHKGGKGGAVVNISSVAGIKALPFGPIYGASKHAIVGLTRDLGHPLHYSISKVTVQCLCPGLARTQFLQDSVKKPFSPEIAEAMKKFAGKITPMEPEVVSNALIQLLNDNIEKNGGVMVVDGERDPFYAEFPELPSAL